MRKRRKKKRNWNLRPWLWAGSQVLLATGLCVAVLSVVCLAGDRAERFLNAQEPNRLRFERIACDAPDGMSREHFLQEVQYVGSLPDHIDIRDTEVSDQLEGAFAAHPRVRRVISVKLDAITGATVELEFAPARSETASRTY